MCSLVLLLFFSFLEYKCILKRLVCEFAASLMNILNNILCSCMLIGQDQEVKREAKKTMEKSRERKNTETKHDAWKKNTEVKIHCRRRCCYCSIWPRTQMRCNGFGYSCLAIIARVYCILYIFRVYLIVQSALQPNRIRNINMARQKLMML